MTSFARGDGVEIDDGQERLDLESIHAFLTESYWAAGRDLATTTALTREATRVVGAYDGGRQIGFARCVSDRVTFAWLADVYVETAYRGRGIGEDIVRMMIHESTFAGVRWILGTADAHSFYAKLGFGPPSERIIERRRPAGDPPAP